MLNLSIGQTQNVKNPAADSLLSQRGRIPLKQRLAR